MKQALVIALLSVALVGCQRGTAVQELEQQRARISTLEAENAHLRGQQSLIESEREQLRQQVNQLATDLAKMQAAGVAEGGGAAIASENLVMLPREVHAGQWIAVHIRNYPPRLLPQAGVAIRAANGQNISPVTRLTANVFLLPVPPNTPPGPYQLVLGEAGPQGPGAKVDDWLSFTVR